VRGNEKERRGEEKEEKERRGGATRERVRGEDLALTNNGRSSI